LFFFTTTKIKKFVVKNILATFAKKVFFMKGKLLFIVVLLISLASCTSVKKVTSIDEYNKNINKVKRDLASKGFQLSGYKKESSNDIFVTGNSYSTQSGYGTSMNNDYSTNDVYTFSTTNGDIAEFSIKYREKYSDYSHTNYIQTIELSGCKTSKVADYEKICGSNSYLQKSLKNIKKDINVEVYDSEKTTVLIYTLTLLACCIPLIFLL
jgi:hypothetical protein